MPTPNVSVVDLVIQTEKKTFAEEVSQLACTFQACSACCTMGHSSLPLT